MDKKQQTEQKRNYLSQELDLRNEKLSKLRLDLAIETDTGIEFKLEKQIQKEEARVVQIEEELDKIEQLLNSLPSQPQQSIDDVSLATQKNVNYHNLRELLKGKKWREADQETKKVMLKVVNRESEGWLSADMLQEFPKEDLQIIDRLWVTASNGHFGFSVQKKIWAECGYPMDYNKNWTMFSSRIGWINEINSQMEDALFSILGIVNIGHSNLKFDTSHSPIGELPIPPVRNKKVVTGLFSHKGL